MGVHICGILYLPSATHDLKIYFSPDQGVERAALGHETGRPAENLEAVPFFECRSQSTSRLPPTTSAMLPDYVL